MSVRRILKKGSVTETVLYKVFQVVGAIILFLGLLRVVTNDSTDLYVKFAARDLANLIDTLGSVNARVIIQYIPIGDYSYDFTNSSVIVKEKQKDYFSLRYYNLPDIVPLNLSIDQPRIEQFRFFKDSSGLFVQGYRAPTLVFRPHVNGQYVCPVAAQKNSVFIDALDLTDFTFYLKESKAIDFAQSADSSNIVISFRSYSCDNCFPAVIVYHTENSYNSACRFVNEFLAAKPDALIHLVAVKSTDVIYSQLFSLTLADKQIVVEFSNAKADFTRELFAVRKGVEGAAGVVT